MTPIAYSTVATAPAPATSGTSLTVAAGTGSRFPAVPFDLLAWPAGSQPTSGNSETLTVTAKVGDVFTVTRGTPARTIVVGFQVADVAIVQHLYDAHPPALGSISDGFISDLSWFKLTDVVGTGETTVSTTGNVDDLNFNNAALIRFTNASLTTLRGLQAGRAGQLVFIVSLGAGHVNLAHQDSGSSAANRLINIAASAPTPLAAGKGIAVLQYDATTQRWRLIAHDQGAAITPTFSAGNFTGSGAMTWTVDSGDVNTCNYRLRGNVLTVAFGLGPTSVGGTPDSFLHMGNGAFGGFTPSFTERAVYIAAPTGTDQLAYGQTVASDTKYYFSSGTTGANWSLGTNTVYLAGQINFTVG